MTTTSADDAKDPINETVGVPAADTSIQDKPPRDQAKRTTRDAIDAFIDRIRHTGANKK